MTDSDLEKLARDLAEMADEAHRLSGLLVHHGIRIPGFDPGQVGGFRDTARTALRFLKSVLVARHEADLAKNISLSPEDLAGLPQELKEQLQFSASDQQELKILEILGQAGGFVSIDRLIVRLFQDTGEIVQRKVLTARLYRMTQKKRLFAVSGMKGVYSLNPDVSAGVSAKPGDADVQVEDLDEDVIGN